MKYNISQEFGVFRKFKSTLNPLWNAKLNKRMWKIYKQGNNVINPLSEEK